MRYRIDPAGVHGSLELTRADAVTMSGNRRPLHSCLESATSGCGGSGAVVAALAAFGAGEQSRMDQISARIESCVSGAAEATAAYVQADAQMAADATAADIRSIPIAAGRLRPAVPRYGTLR